MTNPAQVPEVKAIVVEEEDTLGKWLSEHAGKPITGLDILEQARIEAGLDEEDMDGFPLIDRWDSANGSRWQAFQTPPAADHSMDKFAVLAIFVGDQADRIGDHTIGEGRIYVAPREANGAFYRYKFSSVPGSGGHRAVMKPRLFIEELAHELNRMAVVFNVIADDEEETTYAVLSLDGKKLGEVEADSEEAALEAAKERYPEVEVTVEEEGEE
jgi:hypothetical protein